MTDGGIPKRNLGSTGERLSIIGVGGYHIGKDRDRRLATKIIRTAIDEGVNFLDNAWCYNDGRSEELMGFALEDGYREKVFLMTKNHGRNADDYKIQLDDSLRRLKTDYIDLVQFHDLRKKQEADRIFSEGAIDMAIKAREQGKLRYIGFTGHYRPHVHTHMLDKNFEWDTVQMPANVLDYHYRSFQKEVMPVCVERNYGLLGMKSLAGDAGIKDAGISIKDALEYALSLPVNSLICGIDSMEVLKQNLRIARGFKKLDENAMNRIRSAVRDKATSGKIENYKQG